MKKFFTLLLSSLFSLSMLAYDGSSITISTISNKMDLRIEVDGQKVRMKENTVTLRNLREGYHQVKIFRDKKNGNGFGFGRKSTMVYNSSVYLKRGFVLDIIVSRSGKVFTDEARIDRNSDWYDREDDDTYGDNGGYDNGGYGGGNSNGGYNNGYGNVMSTREFEMVKEQIRKEWFEQNRLTSVKTVIDKNNFTTQQVKELMLLFTFENNRLEVAKYAYRKTVDKHNYHQLNDALTFTSSKDELARFIRESR